MAVWSCPQACLKDCSQHGECSGPGENAYCMCEPGYTGDACDIRELGARLST